MSGMSGIYEISDKIWTPECSTPNGYKLVIHRYYTEIVPVDVNIPKTPIKTTRFMYMAEEEDLKNEKNEKNK